MHSPITKSLLPISALLLALSACSANNDPGSDGETGDALETGDMLETGTPADTETGESGDEDDGHGTIRIEPTPVLDDASIFAGTAEVVATVHYEECLQAFYLASNPSLRQSGPDGGPLFADALSELCTLSDSPACSVVAIEQTLDELTFEYTLRVTYQIDDFATINKADFHVGPLPNSEIAGCQAYIELREAGLVGRNSNGEDIWIISALPGSRTAEADLGVPLRVEVKGI